MQTNFYIKPNLVGLIFVMVVVESGFSQNHFYSTSNDINNDPGVR